MADYILLDQGSGGTGKVFDWSLVGEVERPYFLAGGLDVENLREAIGLLHPWAVDLSSSLEIDGMKNCRTDLSGSGNSKNGGNKRCQKVDLEYTADSIFRRR